MAITKSAVQWPMPYLLPARSIHGQRCTFRNTHDIGKRAVTAILKKAKCSRYHISVRYKSPNLYLIPYSPRPFANPFFRHLLSPNGFHAFSPSLSSYIVSPPHLASFRGGTFVHDLPQCLSGSPFPSDPNETRQSTIRSSVHRVFLSF